MNLATWALVVLFALQAALLQWQVGRPRARLTRYDAVTQSIGCLVGIGLVLKAVGVW